MQAKMSPTPDPALAVIVAALPIAVIALDPENRIRLWNPAAEELFGWREAEVTGGYLPMLSESQRQDLGLTLASGLLAEGDYDVPWQWCNKSGDILRLGMRSAPWLDADGERRGVLLMLRSVSEPKLADPERARLIEQAEQAREEAEGALRFRALLEAAPDAIVQVDQTGCIVLMNRATEGLFGYTREELLGQPVEILVPLASRGAHVGQRTGYRKNPVSRPMGRGLTLSAVRKDGSEFPVEISLSPVDISGEVRVVAIIRDVTERKRIEQDMLTMELRFHRELKEKNNELERRNREVEEADRMKSEFLASMSHELRTPLHTIIGFSQLLAEEIQGPLNDKQRRFVDHIHRDSQHLLELINDILDLSKIESGRIDLRLEVFAAREEVENVVEGIRHRAEAKSIALRFDAPQDYTLRADRVRLREVLLNLLSNALKFTPSGGSVTVSMSAAEEPGYCCFAVADTGIGIPAGQLEAIFDKFHQVGSTTKGVREGTGLGLTITKHIVEMHNCRIWVESEPGRGSRFSFTMPLGTS